MSDYYRAVIKIDDMEWIVTSEDETSDLEDVRVLDSLAMDWAMPEGLWPQQPEPMRAAVALYVPDFSTLPQISDRSACQIQVQLHPDSDPVFSFYGLVSDLQATAATDRPGVILSLAAIDYTVDLAEMKPTAGASGGSGIPTTDHLDDTAGLWLNASLGAFPAWPTSLPDPDVIRPEPWNAPAADTIGQDLLQVAYIGTPGGEFRAILAPFIDPATGVPDTGQPWAFDPVYKTGQGDPLLVQSCHVEIQSLQWVYNKTVAATRIEVTGWGGNSENLSAAANFGPPVTERIAVTLEDEAAADDLAEFYLPGTGFSRTWRLDTLRYRVGLLSEAELEVFPPTFFPQWSLTEGDADRSACYGQLVSVVDIPADRSPFVEELETPATITGRLCGAGLSIGGGRVSLDVQLRQTVLNHT